MARLELATLTRTITADALAHPTDLGPMLTEGACQRIDSWIGEAVAGGASVIAGGATLLDHGDYVRQFESALDRIDVRLLEASRDLGVSPWRTFRKVTLPDSRRGGIITHASDAIRIKAAQVQKKSQR